MRRLPRRSILAVLGGALTGCLRAEVDDRSGSGTTAAQPPPQSGTPTPTSQSPATQATNTTGTQPPEATHRFSPVWQSEQVRTVAVHDGTLYRNAQDELVAHDPATGEVRWRKSPTPNASLGTDITAAGSTIYVGDYGTGTEDGQPSLFAIDASDGTVRWQSPVPMLRTKPLPAGEVVLFSTFADEQGRLFALDAATGERRWEQEAGPITVNGSTALGSVGPDGDAYVVGGSWSEQTAVTRLDPVDGTVVWEWAGERPAGPPVVDGDNVFVGLYDWFAALDAEDGSAEWMESTFAENVTKPVIADETVYFGSSDTGIYALSTADGSRRWRYQTGGAVWGSPVLADGVVVAGSRDSRVYAIHVDSGDLAARYGLSREVSELAVGGGNVFAVTGLHENDGHTLVALSLEERE